ncbi:MAG: tRNA preQ1(34) S-adenosylmethionine ribosyltransferase-isomerase QueA [Gammaproteobacteria bacterium]
MRIRVVFRAMKLSDFDYPLPQRLIAHYPAKPRSQSRLLIPGTDSYQNLQMLDFPDLLRTDDLLVFNDTRVIPARLYGRKETGGKIEVLIERILPQQQILAHVRSSKSPASGMQLLLADGAISVRVVSRQEDLFVLEVENSESILDLLERHGHVPLPPYISREDETQDVSDYQTLYAKHPGAVAAPTAGLHFDADLLAAIEQKGIRKAFVTLHVGAGTFQSVRTENLSEHVMHAEHIRVEESVCEAIRQTRERGGRVIAIGTTVVRSLETAAASGVLAPWEGDSRLFITPGYAFHAVDAMLTNFHLPQSTLLMLVAAFAGHDRMLAAYRYAVAQEYRFFSYGDAMFLEPAV